MPPGRGTPPDRVELVETPSTRAQPEATGTPDGSLIVDASLATKPAMDSLDTRPGRPNREASPPAACPRCGSRDVDRSRRRRFEQLVAVLGWYPFRCHACSRRFLRRSRG
jgi:DNA-directed RNA polymerase subunit RPC12/RpoP